MRSLGAAVLPALLIGCVGVGVGFSDTVFSLEEDSGLRWLYSMRGAQTPPDDVVIVRVDEDTVSDLKKAVRGIAGLPDRLAECRDRRGGFGDSVPMRAQDIPRTFYACVVDELTRRGVAVIAMDVSFTEDRPGTDQLADAIARHGRVVLLTEAHEVWQEGRRNLR